MPLASLSLHEAGSACAGPDVEIEGLSAASGGISVLGVAGGKLVAHTHTEFLNDVEVYDLSTRKLAWKDTLYGLDSLSLSDH